MNRLLPFAVLLLAGPAHAACFNGHGWSEDNPLAGYGTACSLEAWKIIETHGNPPPGQGEFAGSAANMIDIQGTGVSLPPKDPFCLPGWTAVQVGTALDPNTRTVVWKCTPAGDLRDPK